jgi:hypothetical protein
MNPIQPEKKWLGGGSFYLKTVTFKGILIVLQGVEPGPGKENPAEHRSCQMVDVGYTEGKAQVPARRKAWSGLGKQIGNMGIIQPKR